MQALCLVLLVPAIGVLQILAMLIVKKVESPWSKLLILLLSSAAAVDYARLILRSDWSISSTAGLWLVFYPLLMQPTWVVPSCVVLLWIGHRLHARNWADR